MIHEKGSITTVILNDRNTNLAIFVRFVKIMKYRRFLLPKVSPLKVAICNPPNFVSTKISSQAKH